MWILCASPAAAAPLAVALAAAWNADQAAIDRLGPTPIRLTNEDYDRLAEGGPVVHRVDGTDGGYASGAIWVQAPVGLAWVTIQDSGDRPLSADVVYEPLPGETPGRRLVYSRLALPWPVADRQWVSDFASNGALFAATAGRIWQRRWTLGEPSLAPAPDANAVWVEENTGAWTLLEVDDGTLCVVGVHSALGGPVPQWVTQSLAVSTLRSMLQRLASLAPGTRAHYGAAHPQVIDPAGAPVARGG
jgi:hypothetical protein